MVIDEVQDDDGGSLKEDSEGFGACSAEHSEGGGGGEDSNGGGRRQQEEFDWMRFACGRRKVSVWCDTVKIKFRSVVLALG